MPGDFWIKGILKSTSLKSICQKGWALLPILSNKSRGGRDWRGCERRWGLAKQDLWLSWYCCDLPGSTAALLHLVYCILNPRKQNSWQEYLAPPTVWPKKRGRYGEIILSFFKATAGSGILEVEDGGGKAVYCFFLARWCLIYILKEHYHITTWRNVHIVLRSVSSKASSGII